MGKGKQKIEIKKIGSQTARMVTFSKRRKGLFKKAKELTDLFPGTRIAAIVFSPAGNPYVFGEPLSFSTSLAAEPEGVLPPNAPVFGGFSDASLSGRSERVSDIKSALEVDISKLGFDELEKYSDQLKGLRAKVGSSVEQRRMENDDPEPIEENIVTAPLSEIDNDVFMLADEYLQTLVQGSGNSYAFGDPLSFSTSFASEPAGILPPNTPISGGFSDASSRGQSDRVSDVNNALEVDISTVGFDKLQKYSDPLKGLRAQVGSFAEQRSKENDDPEAIVGETVETGSLYDIENQLLMLGDEDLEALVKGFGCDFEEQNHDLFYCL